MRQLLKAFARVMAFPLCRAMPPLLLCAFLATPGHAQVPRVKNHTGKHVRLRPMVHPGNSPFGSFRFELYDSRDPGRREDGTPFGPFALYFMKVSPGFPLVVEFDRGLTSARRLIPSLPPSEHPGRISISEVVIPPDYELEIRECRVSEKIDFAFELRESFREPLPNTGCGVVHFQQAAPGGEPVAQDGITLSCGYLKSGPGDPTLVRIDASGSLILDLKKPPAVPPSGPEHKHPEPAAPEP
jgi:hypothetical protein